MVTSVLIESLDRKNLSKNADSTAERFSADLTSASAEQKKRIAELSGRSRATLYKVKENGVISARLLAATSFTLNVSPYWYTGEAETKEDYSDEIMRKFLTENKYESALQVADETAQEKEKKPKRAYKRKEKQSSPPEEVPRTTDVPQPEEPNEAPQAAANDVQPEEKETTLHETADADEGYFNEDVAESLSFDNAVKLLDSLYIRATATHKANTALMVIKKLLLQN